MWLGATEGLGAVFFEKFDLTKLHPMFNATPHRWAVQADEKILDVVGSQGRSVIQITISRALRKIAHYSTSYFTDCDTLIVQEIDNKRDT